MDDIRINPTEAEYMDAVKKAFSQTFIRRRNKLPADEPRASIDQALKMLEQTKKEIGLITVNSRHLKRYAARIERMTGKPIDGYLWLKYDARYGRVVRKIVERKLRPHDGLILSTDEVQALFQG